MMILSLHPGLSDQRYSAREIFERVGERKFLFLLGIMHQSFNDRNQSGGGSGGWGGGL